MSRDFENPFGSFLKSHTCILVMNPDEQKILRSKAHTRVHGSINHSGPQGENRLSVHRQMNEERKYSMYTQP